MKNIYLTFFLIVGFFSNKKELARTDQLLKIADSYVWIDFLKSLEYAKKASLEAEKNNSSERKAEAYYYIAQSFLFYGDFNNGSIYIRKGMLEPATSQKPQLMALFKDLNSIYYSRMHLFDRQFKESIEFLKLTEIGTGSEDLLLSSRGYMSLADYYTELKDYKQAHFNADKSIAIVEAIPEIQYSSAKRRVKCKAYMYYYKARIYLMENKPALAYPFIEKAYHQALLDKYQYVTLFLELYGDYYYQINQYQKALDYYLKSYDNKKIFLLNESTAAALTTKISATYEMLGDKSRERVYLKMANDYKVIDEKLDKERIANLLSRIESEYKKQHVEYLNKMKILSIAFFLILLIVIHFSLIKRKRYVVIEKEKEKEIIELHSQINAAFAEVIQLAKQNSPHFWARFQEVYPKFMTNMQLVNPDLRVSELTFCAYIYLGFTTKEIAGYTFKAIKTIENYRYYIRKKIKLSPEEDLKLWIIKQVD